jgi:hypothetical protein
MGIMAGVGLVLALMTTSSRREHDTGVSRRPVRNATPDQAVPLAPVRTTAPADLPGLRYLPDDTPVVAGLHVAEARQSDAGTQLLQLVGAGLGGLKQPEATNGLTAEIVESVVLGLNLRPGGVDNPLSHLTIVVRTRAPYDATQVRKQLQAAPQPIQHEPGTVQEKQLYPLNLPVAASLWCADERTLVAIVRFDGVPPNHEWDDVPPNRPVGLVLGGLEQRIQRLQERMSKGAQAWVVGDAGQGESPLKALPRHALAVPDRKALDKVRSFAASARMDMDITCTVAFDCEDAAAARELESRVQTWGLKGDRVKTVIQESWVTIQVKTTPEDIRQALQRGIGGLLRGAHR